MSLLPWYCEPAFVMERPIRLFNQHFGMEFESLDFLPRWSALRVPAWFRSYQIPEQAALEQLLNNSGICELNVTKDKFSVSLCKEHFFNEK